MFGAVLFVDQLSDTYPDYEVEQQLERILSSGDFNVSPDILARMLINYAATVFMTRTMMPEAGLDSQQAQTGLRVLLDRYEGLDRQNPRP